MFNNMHDFCRKYFLDILKKYFVLSWKFKCTKEQNKKKFISQVRHGPDFVITINYNLGGSVAKVRKPVCPGIVVRGTPVTNLASLISSDLESWSSTSVLISAFSESSFLFLEAARRSRFLSNTGRLIFLTWNSLLRHSTVETSVKPQDFSSTQVFWTCSMQGEKEQMRPPDF